MESIIIYKSVQYLSVQIRNTACCIHATTNRNLLPKQLLFFFKFQIHEVSQNMVQSPFLIFHRRYVKDD